MLLPQKKEVNFLPKPEMAVGKNKQYQHIFSICHLLSTKIISDVKSNLCSECSLCVSAPSPSLPACSAAPPGRIFENMPSPSMPGWPAAALPIPPGLGAALEPGWRGERAKRRGGKRGGVSGVERKGWTMLIYKEQIFFFEKAIGMLSHYL